MPDNDQLRRQEENPNTGAVGAGGGTSFSHENLGAPKSSNSPAGSQYSGAMPTPQQEEQQQDQQPDQQQDGPNRLTEEAQERLRKRAKDGGGKGTSAPEGAGGSGQGGAGSAGTGGQAGSGAESAASGAGKGAKSASSGAGKGAAKGAAKGAGSAAKAGAGATGQGAGAAGAAGTAGATGAAGAGAAGAAGTAAGAGATAAGTATGAGVAATTGAETAGVGAAVGLAIVVGTFAATFFAKHWREILTISALGFVGIMILGLALLNSLKPIASTVQTASKYLSPVQQIVDNRSLSILGRFVTGGSDAALSMHAEQQRMAANQPQQQGKVLPLTTDGIVTDGKLKTLFDAMKADNFEARIYQRFGLEFRPASNHVRILRHGQELGRVQSAAEAEQVLRYRFTETQRLLAEELNGWSWAQHTKIGRPMRSEYEIQALAIPGADTATTSGALSEVVKYQVTSVLRTGMNNMQRGLSCFTQGSDCNDFGIPVVPAAHADYQTNQNSSIAAATQTAYDQNLEDINAENDFFVPPLSATAGGLLKESLNGGEGTAIGLLGWLDIAAAMHDMAQQDGAQDLPVLIRGKQAGALWAWNLSAINQMIAGDVTSRASSLINRNFRDIESSQAYNYVANNNTSRGFGMLDSQKVLSSAQRPLETIYQHMLLEHPLIQGSLSVFFGGWRILNGTDSVPIIGRLPIFGDVLSGIQEQSREGLILLAEQTTLGTFIDRYLGSVLYQANILDVIENTIMASSNMLLPICDPADRTYNFFNCMATGAHNVANWACVASFGCGKINLAQKIQLIAASQADMNARLAGMPLRERLFNKTMPNSAINVAAVHSPIPIKATESTAAFAQSLFSTIWSTPSQMASLFSRPAHAANADPSTIDGQDTFGIPVETLRNTPLSPQLTDAAETCPEVQDGQIDMCKADMSTTDALIARYTYDPSYPAVAEDPAAAPGGTVQPGDAAKLAAAILANPNVSYWGVTESSVKADLQRTANGHPAENTACGGTVAINPKLLWVINEALKSHTLMINSLVSDRQRCGGYHPQGNAIDIDFIDGVKATPGSLSSSHYREFATKLGGWIASVSEFGGIGQKECLGTLAIPSNILQGPDTCNHLHFSVDTSGSSF